MKKLAVALAGALFLAASAPVFACPHEDKENNEVKTAEKDKAGRTGSKAAPANIDILKTCIVVAFRFTGRRPRRR